MKRKFDVKEMTFAMKMLKSMEEDKEHVLFQLKYHDLMIDTGLEMNYKRIIRDYKEKKRGFDGELIIVKEKMKILQDQIRNGVEIKEKKKEEEK